MVSLQRSTGHWPPGRPLLAQDFIDHHKRERCVVALSEVVHEGGTGNLSVARVVQRAKMARGTFYELFENQDDAFRYAIETGQKALTEAIAQAAEEPGAWEERVERVIAALLVAVEDDRCLAELCLLHSAGRMGAGIGPYDPAIVAALSQVLEPPRAEDQEREPRPWVAELLARGILSVTAERLRRREVTGLRELAPELAELATIERSSVR